MLFKLSVKNIEKSIKDYSIYFFTLVFAVAMFYMFNSVDAQSSMLVLNNSKYDIIKTLVTLISYVSVFVSVVLGFLIVYSNNFLIRRRKKEIGLYEILGMSKRKVSFILVIETIIIGVLSLVVGLLVGIFLSQFLSLFVAKMFEVNMNKFQFIFSSLAFKKTIIYFGIIFLLVVVFNTITLSRYKLIDLITADKKNEKVKIRGKYITIISFILSLGLLGYAYYLLLFDKALVMLDYKLIVMLVSGALGTFLLFFSLSGFLLKTLKRNKKLYYKGLNLFTLKQVNSRINTTVISTTVICLMLLLTIGLLSGSMSLARLFNNDFASNNLVDYSVMLQNMAEYTTDEKEIDEYNESFNKIEDAIGNKEFNKYSDEYVLLHKFADKKLFIKDLMDKKTIAKIKKKYGTGVSLNYNIPIIKEREYKEFMEMTNQKSIDIKDNEYLLMTNVDFIIDSFKPNYEKNSNITVNNIKLTPGSKSIIKTSIENNTSAGNDGIIVVSDSVVDGLYLLNKSLVGNFADNNDEEKVGDKLNDYLKANIGDGYDCRTRITMEASSLGLKTMVIFLGLYLGITFAISSATVLAIGQLSESSDNKKRYRILRQIGADEKMINKALLTQTAITFGFPLVVALIHSYFGLRELNSLLISFGTLDLTSNILLTALFMVTLYGGYFLITYLSSKNIIKE